MCDHNNAATSTIPCPACAGSGYGDYDVADAVGACVHCSGYGVIAVPTTPTFGPACRYCGGAIEGAACPLCGEADGV